MPRFPLEKRRVIRCGIAQIIRYIVQRDTLFDVLIHIMNNYLGDVVVVNSAAVHLPILVDIAQRAQKIMEKRRSVAQILKSEARLQGAVDVLEEVYSVADAGMWAW